MSKDKLSKADIRHMQLWGNYIAFREIRLLRNKRHRKVKLKKRIKSKRKRIKWYNENK